jgi:hypothetical protein
MIHRLAVLVVLCAVSCSSVELAPRSVRVRLGPAHDQPTRRVVALPATCSSLITPRQESQLATSPSNDAMEAASPCLSRLVDAVDGRVRALLAFQGFEVIDSEKVNAETRVRTESEKRMTTPGFETSARTTEVSGATFADATPATQEAILGELGADGVINTRIWIGAGHGFSERHTVEVQVRLLHVRTGRLAWARRCEVEIGGLTADAEAMEEAARCAVQGMVPR